MRGIIYIRVEWGGRRWRWGKWGREGWLFRLLIFGCRIAYILTMNWMKRDLSR